MTIKKTIGGNRLGSGKKMSVDLKTYERSTHNLNYIWRSTMASGTLVPFMSELTLPGDTFDIDLEVDGKTHPTVGPLFGSYKMQLDVFLCPVRLYQGQLNNDKLGIGMKMSEVKLPQIQMTANAIDKTKDPDNQQINPSSIFSYLNIRGLNNGGGDEDGQVTREFNAIPYIGYWDIYKNYYANKQEEVGAVIHNNRLAIDENVQSISLSNGTNSTPIPATGANVYFGRDLLDRFNIASSDGEQTNPNDIKLNTNIGDINLGTTMQFWYWDEGQMVMIGQNPYWRDSKFTIYGWEYISGTDVVEEKPQIEFFPLSNIDDLREDILTKTKQTTPFMVNSSTPAPYGLALKRVLGSDSTYRHSKMSSQEGLALKTYQSDLFNNWMSTEWIDGENGINAITAIDTTSGEITIDTIQLANKVYDMLNRIAISGGSYDDWQEAVYTHSRPKRATTPMYMGGLIRELVFQEVVSNAESVDGEQPIGTLAGKGVMSGKKKGGKITIKADEPSYIIGIVSLTPRIDYSQGNKWDVNLKTMDDFHKPALDEIGFQDLITDQMAWWDTIGTETEGAVFKSAGKQPAWINYMTNVNQTRGNFAIPVGTGDNGGGEMFMTLNRKYEIDEEVGGIKDLTTYIDPAKFNDIFAQKSRDSQNFWVQIAIDITARRKMSAKIMPNL